MGRRQEEREMRHHGVRGARWGSEGWDEDSGAGKGGGVEGDEVCLSLN